MKKLLFILLIMLTIGLSVGCNQAKETNLLIPPGTGEFISFRPSSLVYQNPASKLYSLGDVGPIFTLNDDTLEVKNSEEVNIYEISYDEVELTVDDLKKQFQQDSEVSDISSYKGILQYDLCKSTKDSPGYRLYILDGEYWMGTLYNNSIWRIVSLAIDK